MNGLDIAPIKEVMSIIDSCTNEGQLKTCEELKRIYSRMAKSKGVINPEDIEKALDIKIQEKREEIQYAEEFCR